MPGEDIGSWLKTHRMRSNELTGRPATNTNTAPTPDPLPIN
jgi:hypothetical protein